MAAALSAERTDSLAALEQKAGDDRVVGLLAARETVVALRVEREVRPAVLKGNARAGDGDARAKAAVVALNKRDHIALAVRGAEVDGTAAVRVARLRLERFVRDERAAGGKISRGQELADLCSHVSRIGDIGLCVGKGQLDDLHDLMVVRRILAALGK